MARSRFNKQVKLDRIKKLRSLMLIHSYIYYHLDDNLVTDHRWQEWANELRDLQEQFTETIAYYDEYFKSWTGSTGMHLPANTWVKTLAQRLIAYRDKQEAVRRETRRPVRRRRRKTN